MKHCSNAQTPMSGITNSKKEFQLTVKKVNLKLKDWTGLRRKHTNPAQQESKQLTILPENLMDKHSGSMTRVTTLFETF